MSQDTSHTGHPPAGTRQQGNGLAIAGFVCGLVGLLFFSVILGPLAIVFGGIGLNRAQRGAPHKGLSIAAIVLGVVDLILFVVLVVAAANNGGSFTFNVG
ncbi:DUF4190 domain-containing protein [Trujillonella humicola]|uniref:DUF4190 domain-containing protein n=1 Tax=Trujillonella humicola TaxID=3383699 RepID=UPI003905D656